MDSPSLPAPGIKRICVNYFQKCVEHGIFRQSTMSALILLNKLKSLSLSWKLWFFNYFKIRQNEIVSLLWKEWILRLILRWNFFNDFRIFALKTFQIIRKLRKYQWTWDSLGHSFNNETWAMSTNSSGWILYAFFNAWSGYGKGVFRDSWTVGSRCHTYPDLFMNIIDMTKKTWLVLVNPTTFVLCRRRLLIRTSFEITYCPNDLWKFGFVVDLLLSLTVEGTLASLFFSTLELLQEYLKIWRILA